MVAKLDGGKLSFGFVRECVGVVVNVVDFDGWHDLILSLITKPHPLVRDGVDFELVEELV